MARLLQRFSRLTLAALGLVALIGVLLLQRWLMTGPVWFIPIRHGIILYSIGALLLYVLIIFAAFIVNLFKIRVHLLEMLVMCAAGSIPLGLNVKEALAAPDSGTAGMWLGAAAACLFSVVVGALGGVNYANRKGETRTWRRLLYMGVGITVLGALLAVPASVFLAEQRGATVPEYAKIALVCGSYAVFAVTILIERRSRRHNLNTED